MVKTPIEISASVNPRIFRPQNNDKQPIITFEKLKQVSFCNFCLKFVLKQSVVQTVAYYFSSNLATAA